MLNIYDAFIWIKPLKDKKGNFPNAFLKQQMNLILNQINYWLIKEESFTIKLCQNGQNGYSAHNEGKSEIAERFIKIIKI